MKKIVLWFSFFFLIFFTLGFVEGRAKALAPDEMKLIAASKSTLMFKENKAYLQISLNQNDPNWLFDIDSNEITKLSPVLILEFRSKKKFPIDETILKGFIGGTTAWKLTDVIKALSASNKNSTDRGAILMSVVGGVSGYLTGHYAGNAITRSTIHEQLVAVLQDKNACKEIKRLVLMQLYKQHEVEILKILKESSTKLIENNTLDFLDMIRAFNDIQNPNTEINSEHFIALKKLESI